MTAQGRPVQDDCAEEEPGHKSNLPAVRGSGKDHGGCRQMQFTGHQAKFPRQTIPAITG